MDDHDLERLRRALQQEVVQHLYAVGFHGDTDSLAPPQNGEKVQRRAMHSAQRAERLQSEAAFIGERSDSLLPHFAEGVEVVPDQIAPRLEAIRAGTTESDLFRLASLTWSVPVSRGYGRRIRFLIWDDSNQKLMGIAAIGDPVFNLKVRDGLVGWTADERRERLVNVMDAYVLGALPPYNQLLCGKLIACLLRTQEMKEHFAQRYRRTVGIISGKKKRAQLAMITTSSALGRSSVYNRLKLDGTQYLEPIGYTTGWGHFHIPDALFAAMRSYLGAIGHPYAHNHDFGDGPNWRLRTIREALKHLGLDPDVLRHGIRREVFICRLADNCTAFLRGDQKRARFDSLLSAAEVAEQALTRWVVPRASRRPGYRSWRREQIIDLLDPSTSHTADAQ